MTVLDGLGTSPPREVPEHHPMHASRAAQRRLLAESFNEQLRGCRDGGARGLCNCSLLPLSIARRHSGENQNKYDRIRTTPRILCGCWRGKLTPERRGVQSPPGAISSRWAAAAGGGKVGQQKLRSYLQKPRSYLQKPRSYLQKRRSPEVVLSLQVGVSKWRDDLARHDENNRSLFFGVSPWKLAVSSSSFKSSVYKDIGFMVFQSGPSPFY
ncbi:hypothetical protein C7M84_007209 [Penaeus vannamei]|uniref:Uncharacterized protein n=1 Tax=Penaeus vannamei TaxID=6689 RepID=A0A423TCX4_PENVA|nr:hypothetical protein C7M84_007209 [Penaeus vannamei]